jgi:glycosyltransferase involved in cell wall biosynthesis
MQDNCQGIRDSIRALLTANVRLTDTDGKSIRILNLAELFNKLGFAVTLVVSECVSTKAGKFTVIETKTPLNDTAPNNILKKIFYHINQMIMLFGFYMKLAVLRTNYDVIISEQVGPEINALFAYIFSKIRKVPFVYDYDDPTIELGMLFYNCSMYDLRLLHTLISKKILLRNANLVLTASESIKRRILEDVGKNKRVYVFYNSPRMDDIYVNEDRNRLREKLGLNMNSFIVSYLGNPPLWGIDTCIQILVNCAKAFGYDEKVLFLIIGGGKWEEYYHKIIENSQLTDRIIITGRKTRESALEYFAASDVCCFPFEPNCASVHMAPTKLFEAMALGIPILCPRLPNLVQILGDDGIYFDEVSDLIKKIRWCLTNQEKLNKIASNLKFRYLHEYAWERITLRLKDDIWEVLLNSLSNRFR